MRLTTVPTVPTCSTSCALQRLRVLACTESGFHCAAKRAGAYIRFDIVSGMKPITFMGDALKELRDFPEGARQDAGYQLRQVQRGEQPDDFKPMSAVGTGVEELRVWSDEGTFRVLYLARLPEAVYVLHAFQKKTQATPKRDIDLAARRYRELIRSRT
jgi:phage-related protein